MNRQLRPISNAGRENELQIPSLPDYFDSPDSQFWLPVDSEATDPRFDFGYIFGLTLDVVTEAASDFALPSQRQPTDVSKESWISRNRLPVNPKPTDHSNAHMTHASAKSPGLEAFQVVLKLVNVNSTQETMTRATGPPPTGKARACCFALPLSLHQLQQLQDGLAM